MSRGHGRRYRDVPDTMEIAVSVRRAIVIHDDIDALNINTAPKDVRSDQDTGFEQLESLVTFDSTTGSLLDPWTIQR